MTPDNSDMTARTLPEWLAFIERQHPKTIAMGLERVRAVADAMVLTGLTRSGPAPHVITVGGTNGKGSTVAFIEAIARAAGLRVGAYTSPHLLRYNERVRIDGADADDAALVAAFEAVEAARGGMPGGGVALTYFEYGTLAALWLFARSDLDLVVLEVGLGGRLDAVNIVDADVAVITTVDLDHQDWLGDDIETIGAEKAGIARAWKPLVLGDDDPPSRVLGHAYAIGASAIRIGCDFFFEAIDAERWRWREIGCELDLPMPRLAAPVQLRNAAVAIAALRALPVELPERAIAAGVRDARVAARLQRFERDGVEILIDVGHNPQAARAGRMAGDDAGAGADVRGLRGAGRQGHRRRGRRAGGPDRSLVVGGPRRRRPARAGRGRLRRTPIGDRRGGRRAWHDGRRGIGRGPRGDGSGWAGAGLRLVPHRGGRVGGARGRLNIPSSVPRSGMAGRGV